MKIYTKTGDEGETGLWGGLRVSKDTIRVHAYGTVDECNAAIGVARTAHMPARIDALLETVQNQLFVVGADLATPGEAANIPRVHNDDVTVLEHAIDELESQLPALTQFILPGGHPAAAHLHLARTICRRAERYVVSLAREEACNAVIGIYLNRLSDFLCTCGQSPDQRGRCALE
ncbi:MAG: cob(I)yrinic acid a,c-diamide adenosyltransferase [Chloroflexaceae bacterium]|nr:cob(I)yrinic acid a,c-diamide adenosyltransferase [Chloroflexaceae bacterium]